MIDVRLAGYDGPRTPRPEEWEATMELSRSVFFPDAAHYRDAARRWTMGLHVDLRESVFAMFHNGQPVAAIMRVERDFIVNGCTLRMGFVGGVCTHPDHRKRGLASTTLAATLDLFHKRGCDFAYISGGRPLYFAAGANHAGGLTQYALGRDELAAFDDAAVSTREATLDDAPAMAGLNQREGLHFVRPFDDYRLTLEQHHCSGKACRVDMVMVRGAIVGYAISTRPWAKDGKVGMSLLECAGPPGAVLAALAQVRANAGDAAVLTASFPSAGAWATYLDAAGLESHPAAHGGTIKALDFARTMVKLQPCLAERLPREVAKSLQWTQGGERYAGWCEGGALTIDGETNMLWTLLGAPPGKAAENVVATGSMQAFLGACLPIPLPGVDMNKI